MSLALYRNSNSAGGERASSESGLQAPLEGSSEGRAGDMAVRELLGEGGRARAWSAVRCHGRSARVRALPVCAAMKLIGADAR